MSSKIISSSLRPTGSSPSILPMAAAKDASQTIYVGHYDAARYARLNDADLWTQLSHQKLGMIPLHHTLEYIYKNMPSF